MAARTRRPPRGQHFLVAPRVVDAIVRAAAPHGGERLLEIGPGRGALTFPLAEIVGRLVAVEVDRELAASLRTELAGHDAVVVLHEDATRMSWHDVMREALAGAGPYEVVRLVGNLPYDVGTGIVLDYLEHSAKDPRLGEAVVMLQAEVAERLVAVPRSKAYASLAALAQATHEARTLLDVGPSAFRPPPRVHSRVVVLTPRHAPLFPPAERSRHASFVHAAFAHRRKQLASSLAGRDGLPRERWWELLDDLGHAPTARAEELSPAELVALSRAADSSSV